MTHFIKALLVLTAIAGCTSTSVIPVSQNEFILNTSAAPACGGAGAARVATQMAAVETLRSGKTRFMIVGTQSQNNVRVMQTAPTGAYTTSNYSAYGNSLSGSSNTTFTGGGPLIFGEHSQQMAVRTFSPGDPGFRNAVDAKRVLGPDWEAKIEKGVKTCT